jgi:hypothetical protein
MSIQFRFQAHKSITIGYAADGYARIRGISVIATTLGVGELSAINAIAGSSAELVPVIHIVGYPSTTAMDKGALLHHTLADGDFGRFAKMSEQISSAVVILKDKSTASKCIDETITECYRSSKPVYIGFPMDLVQAKVDPSPLERPLVLEEPASNPIAVEENVVNMVLDRILGAQNPIIIVDSLGGKPQVLKSTRSFVEKSGLPCFIMPMAKGIVDESLINYRGVYAERVSEPSVFEQVQLSDLVLVIGPRPTDLNTAGFRTDMPHIETIKFGRDTVEMRGQEATSLKMSGVITKLSDAFDGRMSPSWTETRAPSTKMTGMEVIGAASGLAGLFTTTITWFDYIYVARKAAPRLQSLIVKLGNAQLRLTRWGQAVGLTGSDVEDEESLKNSGSFQLDEEQENQALRIFQILATLFEESKKICHKERKGKSEDDPEVKANEIEPFGQNDFKWSTMHRYLHETMQKIVHERRNKMSAPRLLKFAIYDEKHLEKLVKDINDHTDALYQIYAPSASDEEEAGADEMDKLLKIMKELRSASERDPVINAAVKNILKQSVSGCRSCSPICNPSSCC